MLNFALLSEDIGTIAQSVNDFVSWVQSIVPESLLDGIRDFWSSSGLAGMTAGQNLETLFVIAGISMLVTGALKVSKALIGTAIGLVVLAVFAAAIL